MVILLVFRQRNSALLNCYRLCTNVISDLWRPAKFHFWNRHITCESLDYVHFVELCRISPFVCKIMCVDNLHNSTLSFHPAIMLRTDVCWEAHSWLATWRVCQSITMTLMMALISLMCWFNPFSPTLFLIVAKISLPKHPAPYLSNPLF